MKINIIVFFLLGWVVDIFAQPVVADKIVAVVGKNAILFSEVEEQVLQEKAQRRNVERCDIFEDMLAQKLMVAQAEIDSITVGDGEVEMELDQRITYFINQIGSEEKLVAYFGKSIIEIKEDMRDLIREQLLMQRMQSEIVKNISITPREVKEFFSEMPSDSIPYIDSEIELRQVLVYPKANDNSVFETKEKLLNIRERILNGENFSTLAVIYSECPSAAKGGELGWATKMELDPAYFKASNALKPGQISKIVESSFGFHLIQLQEKTPDRIKTRHILLKPKVSPEAKQEAKKFLDSLSRSIRLDSIKFETAAMYFSQDENSRLNGGLRINPATQTTRFKITDFPTSEYYVIRNLKVGEISEPYESTDEKGKPVFKIVQLRSKTEPHKANLKQDFDLIKNMALMDKRLKMVDEWIENKARDVYIRIEAPYSDCNLRLNCWKK
ncbi:MAG: peptidylprolyl isomerase [Bacteroidales bacterium]|nr:peptidylprolyl isomerase [Bacteroidales bacterium]